MKPSPFKRHPLSIAFASILSTASLVPTAQANELIWDGSGDNDSWFYSNNNLFNPNTNWTNNDVVPTSGDSLVFTGNTRLTPLNDDLPGFIVSGITFDQSAGSFQLDGNTINSTGNINNLSGNQQTINMPITIGANQIWDGGTGGMAVNGIVTLGNHELTLLNKTDLQNTGDFHVDVASLVLQSGSTLSNITGYLGYSINGDGSAKVTGVGSYWANSSFLSVGESGSGGLSIENGGKVSNVDGYLGFNAGSYGIATVTGVGSKWDNSESLFVGSAGSGWLSILDGGVVSNVDGFVGDTYGSDGGAIVSGKDSLWVNSGFLSVGDSGIGRLTIEDGGNVSNVDGFLGHKSGSTGRVLVTDLGSHWVNDHELTIGNHGEGHLAILLGGSVNDTNGIVASNVGSSGSVLVDGTDSIWQNSKLLLVGGNGTGSLNIRNGGQVSDSDGFVGYGNNVGQSDVTVGASGSQWVNSHSLTISYAGKGKLTINDGGTVSVGEILAIGQQGELYLSGGTVKTGTIDKHGNGKFNWSSGTLNITGSNGAAIGSRSFLAAATTLKSEQSLEVDHSLTIDKGALLSQTGTAKVKAGSLLVNGEYALIGGTSQVENTLQNNGVINSVNTTLVSKTFNNSKSGIITLSGAGGIHTGSFNNSGIVYLNSGASIEGDIVNNVNALITRNELVIRRDKNFLGNIINNGSFYNDSLDSNMFAATVSGSGTFEGGNTYFLGDLRPGNGTGYMDATGTVTLGENSNTWMELGGLVRGEHYDAFDVLTGSLTLGGTLHVDWSNGFTASVGDSFDLFRADDLSGSFTSILFPSLNGINWQVAVLNDAIGSTDVYRLTAAPVPLPAGILLFLSGLITTLAVSGCRKTADSLS